MPKSKIEWTERIWNPTTGCTKVSQGCKNCLHPNTPILMSDLSWKKIQDVSIGDELVSFTESPELGENRVYLKSKVLNKWESEKYPIRIKFSDREIVSSGDHLFLSYTRPNWRKAESLSLKSGLIDIGKNDIDIDIESKEYLSGYISGAISGDGTMRIDGSGKNGTKQSYMRIAVLESDRPILERVKFGLELLGCKNINIRNYDNGNSKKGLVTTPKENKKPLIKLETRVMENLLIIRDCMRYLDTKGLRYDCGLSWQAGFLAGFFDTDGCYSGKNIRFFQKKENDLLEKTKEYINEFGFKAKIEKYRNSSSSVIFQGDLQEKIKFLSIIRPSLVRKLQDFYGRRFCGKRKIQVDGIERGDSKIKMIDIETSTGTFIANGIATHNCYAETMSKRIQAMGNHRYKNGFRFTIHEDALDIPKKLKKPSIYFVNSMSDLFHERMPYHFLKKVFLVMNECEHHIFQVLTKRPEVLEDFWFIKDNGDRQSPWTDNIWIGTSVESQDYVSRIDFLKRCDAKTKFISFEPLLGPIKDLDLTGISWAIVGGESGSGARTMEIEWARDIMKQCKEQGVKFFMKQIGGQRNKKNKLEDFPEDLRVREMPHNFN